METKILDVGWDENMFMVAMGDINFHRKLEKVRGRNMEIIVNSKGIMLDTPSR